MSQIKLRAVNAMALFSSGGTLVCCALPALLVSLGMGTALAGLVTTIPGIVLLSEYKSLVFTFAGIMLSINGLAMWASRNAACPVDPELKEACIGARRTNKLIFTLSISMFVVGFFFAYVAPRVF